MGHGGHDLLLLCIGAAEAGAGGFVHGEAVAVHRVCERLRVVPELELDGHLIAVDGVSAVLLGKAVVEFDLAAAVKRPGDDTVQAEVARPCSGEGVLAAAGGEDEEQHGDNEKQRYDFFHDKVPFLF